MHTPSSNGSPRRSLKLFDTTLRDGLQGRGISTTLEGELAIAQSLLEAGFDTIEAGCPISSEEEVERIRRIGEMARDYHSLIAAFAKCDEESIAKAHDALDTAGNLGMVSLLTSVSRHHLRVMFGSRKGSIPYGKATEEFTKYTNMASNGKRMPVHVYLEDATRANRRYLLNELIPALCENGATTVSDPDTTGWVNNPAWYGQHIADIRRATPAHVLVSAHTHNDLGLAVANGLAAVEKGADQIEGTITGWGERLGNMSWEEFLYIVHKGPYRHRIDTALTLKQIGKAERTFLEHTGAQIDPKKPLLGDDRFRTKAGIHQAKIRKRPSTYLAIDPRFLGLKGPADTTVFGPGSGRNAIIQALEEAGVDPYQLLKRNDPRMDHVKQLAVALAKTTQEGDLPLDVVAALTMNVVGDGGRYELVSISYEGEDIGVEGNAYDGDKERRQFLTLNVRDRENNDVCCWEGSGTHGLIGIACDVLSREIGIPLTVAENGWQSRSIGKGGEAPEFISARLKNGRQNYTGLGLDPDSTEAGFKAVLRAFNKAVAWQKAHPHT